MNRERGAVLVLTLLVLIGVSMVALTAARSAVVVGQLARTGADQDMAFAAAQAALADAEREIRLGSRAALFDSAVPGPAIWASLDLEAAAHTVELGAFTGARLPTGRGALPSRAPRYLVEVVAAGDAGDDAGTARPPDYRITAIGFGPDPRTIAVVQSHYRKEPP